MTSKNGTGKNSAMSHQRLFGTDGIRGVANVEPMTAETALRSEYREAFVKRRPSLFGWITSSNLRSGRNGRHASAAA